MMYDLSVLLQVHSTQKLSLAKPATLTQSLYKNALGPTCSVLNTYFGRSQKHLVMAESLLLDKVACYSKLGVFLLQEQQMFYRHYSHKKRNDSLETRFVLMEISMLC